MPYWLLMARLIDNNIMHERPEKEDPNVQKGSGGDFAKFMM